MSFTYLNLTVAVVVLSYAPDDEFTPGMYPAAAGKRETLSTPFAYECQLFETLNSP
jgi:hypothetical protein